MNQKTGLRQYIQHPILRNCFEQNKKLIAFENFNGCLSFFCSLSLKVQKRLMFRNI